MSWGAYEGGQSKRRLQPTGRPGGSQQPVTGRCGELPRRTDPRVSTQSRSPFQEGVREFYTVPDHPATRYRKEIRAFSSSTTPSTDVDCSCTEMINFSTVMAALLWTDFAVL